MTEEVVIDAQFEEIFKAAITGMCAAYSSYKNPTLDEFSTGVVDIAYDIAKKAIDKLKQQPNE